MFCLCLFVVEVMSSQEVEGQRTFVLRHYLTEFATERLSLNVGCVFPSNIVNWFDHYCIAHTGVPIAKCVVFIGGTRSQKVLLIGTEK